MSADPQRVRKAQGRLVSPMTPHKPKVFAVLRHNEQKPGVAKELSLSPETKASRGATRALGQAQQVRLTVVGHNNDQVG